MYVHDCVIPGVSNLLLVIHYYDSNKCHIFILVCLHVCTYHVYMYPTQVITKLAERQEGEPWPVGRSGHAACCLGFGSKHPHLLVTGGVDNDDKTLRDAWLFDVTNRKWKEVSEVNVVAQLCF